MAEITAAMVKALREETGLGMMECKKALQDAGGDADAARDALRTKGITTAQKKAERVTKEGLVAICASENGSSAAMVEIQCETDFCSRNDEFKNMVAEMAKAAAQMDDGEIQPTAEMTETLQATLAKIGENMGFARGVKITADCVGKYIHHNGKVGVLVGVNGEASYETLSDLCMHIAFANPMGINKEDVPAELVEKEKEVAKQQAIESGKPEEIAEKMVVGKVNKFLAANALLEQPFVRDDKKKVKEIVGDATITSFARFAIGS